jgi:hypothetical protein
MDCGQIITKETLAWAAGLFDGEGCIYIKRRSVLIPQRRERSPVYQLVIKVKLIDRPVVEFIAETFRVGRVIAERPGKIEVRTGWRWEASGHSALSFLLQIEPHLRIKGPEVALAVQFIELMRTTTRQGVLVPNDVLKQRDELYWRMRQLKRREWKAAA